MLESVTLTPVCWKSFPCSVFRAALREIGGTGNLQRIMTKEVQRLRVWTLYLSGQIYGIICYFTIYFFRTLMSSQFYLCRILGSRSSLTKGNGMSSLITWLSFFHLIASRACHPWKPVFLMWQGIAELTRRIIDCKQTRFGNWSLFRYFLLNALILCLVSLLLAGYVSRVIPHVFFHGSLPPLARVLVTRELIFNLFRDLVIISLVTRSRANTLTNRWKGEWQLFGNLDYAPGQSLISCHAISTLLYSFVVATT